MAAIGDAWADGAWIEASWVSGAWAVGVAAISERFGVYRGIGVGNKGVSDKDSVGREHVSRISEE